MVARALEAFPSVDSLRELVREEGGAASVAALEQALTDVNVSRHRKERGVSELMALAWGAMVLSKESPAGLSAGAALYREVLRFDSRNLTAYLSLARCLEQLARYDEAHATYDQGLEALPNNPEILSGKGFLLRRQGDLEGAARFMLAEGESRLASGDAVAAGECFQLVGVSGFFKGARLEELTRRARQAIREQETDRGR